jgi:hypothetical protein
MKRWIEGKINNITGTVEFWLTVHIFIDTISVRTTTTMRFVLRTFFGYGAPLTDSLQIAINEYLSGRWNLPATIELDKVRVDRAIQIAKEAAQLILSELCAGVGITIPELGADLTRESDTCFKLVYKPAVHNAGGVVIPWHVDFGILTFLWYDDATTQVPIFDKDGKQTEEFEDVGVKDGCVLVYVSQDLETKSKGRLRGATHRVVAPPGEKRLKNGLVYMIRPYTS